ncbi:MAG: hypothetical protein GWN30_19165, partial [Gammaproteobacteria bacterium]|nr:hypothetical protein [Gammaproteobacteria bacterium]
HQEDEVFEALGVNGSERVSHSFPWRSPCLVGIASRAGGTMQEIDFSVIENARIEAVSIHAKTTSMTLTRLKEMLPEGLILARIAVPFAPHKVSPEKWLEGMRLDIDRLYRLGVRYFEIQRMPNVTQFGWGTTWTSGDQFGQWWLAVAEKLWVEFSGIKLGFPGVSPGGQVPGMRMDSEVFLDGSDNVIRKADWLGVNCFWAHPTEMGREEKGSYYEKMRQRYPNKLLFITEFGNLNPHTRPEVKGSEYVRFYERLRKSPGIGAAFAQVVSSAQGYQAMSWRTEDGELTGIVRAVRERPF